MSHDRYGDDHDHNLRQQGLGDGWGRDSSRPPFEAIGPDDDEQ
jgi:hypothetical protein